MPRTSRQTLHGTALSMIAALPFLLCCHRAAEERRPNIVCILADDLGIDALRCYGGESFQTPEIDALARSGMRFENCYATPLCTPSRVQFLTGKYPERTGWTGNIQHDPNGDAPAAGTFVDPALGTFARLLREAGYATATAGKWQLCHFKEHRDHVRECGFDQYCCWTWAVDGFATSRYWNPAIYQDGHFTERVEGGYGPDLFCEYLLRFASQHRDGPFLIFYSMVLPHKPYVPPPSVVGKNGPTPTNRSDTANFAASVEYLDRVVGRVRNTLRRIGLAENTLLVFMADNGTPNEIDLRYRQREVQGGKARFSESGMRVPLIVSWPGVVPEGAVRDDLIDLTDFLPTFAELAGVAVPDDVDGVSFAPILLGKEAGTRQQVFSHQGEFRCVRGKRLKYYSDGRLFDVIADPFEERDLSGDPTLAVERERLARLLSEVR